MECAAHGWRFVGNDPGTYGCWNLVVPNSDQGNKPSQQARRILRRLLPLFTLSPTWFSGTMAGHLKGIYYWRYTHCFTSMIMGGRVSNSNMFFGASTPDLKARDMMVIQMSG